MGHNTIIVIPIVVDGLLWWKPRTNGSSRTNINPEVDVIVVFISK